MNFVKKNYHWIIAFTLALQLFFVTGASTTFPNIHLNPVCEYLGIDRTAFSLAYSAKNLCLAVATFLSGLILTKIKIHWVLGGGTILVSLTYLGLAQYLPSAAFLFLYCAVMGLATGLCSIALTTQIVNAWFHKHRGLILGTISAGSAVGASFLSIVQPLAIEKGGSFQSSFLLTFILIGITGLAVLLLVRGTPEEKGLSPYGEGEEVIGRKKKAVAKAKEGLPFSKICRQPLFYVSILTLFLSCFCVYILTSTLVPHLEANGIPNQQATKISSVFFLLISGFKLIIGFLCDHIGTKKTTVICAVFLSVGLLLLSFAHTVGFAYFAACIFAFGVPFTTVMPPLISFSLLGYRAQKQYTGIFIGAVNLSNMVSTVVSGLFYDAFQTYNHIVRIGAGIALLMAALWPLLFFLFEKNEKKMNEIAE